MAQKKNTCAQRFRDSATEEEWKEAVKDHDTLSPIDFKDKYGCTWSAIQNDAAELGYYKKKHVRINSSSRVQTFIIPDQAGDVKKIARSVQLDEAVYERLKKLERDKGQYTHSSILNHLLGEALSIFGY